MERDLSVSPPCEDSAQCNVSTVLEPTQFLTIHARMLNTSSQRYSVFCWQMIQAEVLSPDSVPELHQLLPH